MSLLTTASTTVSTTGPTTAITAARIETHRSAEPRLSLQAVVGVVTAHIGILALLASLEVVPLPSAVSTLMVDLIPPAQPTHRAPPTEITPPRPRPTETPTHPRRALKPVAQPTLTSQTESTSTVTEAPVIIETPPPAPPSPTAITQPHFDAGYLSNPAPNYPPLSRRMGEEGKVLLRVHVDAGGRPVQIELKTSSGSPRLDQATQDAVWRWKFVPARRGDEAVSAWVLVPIVFTLKN
jgi:protein TonB